MSDEWFAEWFPWLYSLNPRDFIPWVPTVNWMFKNVDPKVREGGERRERERERARARRERALKKPRPAAASTRHPPTHPRTHHAPTRRQTSALHYLKVVGKWIPLMGKANATLLARHAVKLLGG